MVKVSLPEPPPLIVKVSLPLPVVRAPLIVEGVIAASGEPGDEGVVAFPKADRTVDGERIVAITGATDGEGVVAIAGAKAAADGESVIAGAWAANREGIVAVAGRYPAVIVKVSLPLPALLMMNVSLPAALEKLPMVKVSLPPP